jgi:hypothetical protein
MKLNLKTLIVLCAALVFTTSEISAKGGGGGGRSSGGGGFRSSGSSGSSPRYSGSTSRPTTTSNKPAAVAPSRYTGSSPQTPASGTTSRYSGGTNTAGGTKQTPKFANQQQKQRYESAVKQGTAFSSKAEAQSAFKQKYASQYTSKYTTPPATRPSHIPATTTVGGKTVNVTYNQSYGGYGYTNGLGAFILYDAMSDAIMMNALMSNHNYVTHPPMVSSPVVVHHGPSALTVFLWICFIGVGIVVLVKIFE